MYRQCASCSCAPYTSCGALHLRDFLEKQPAAVAVPGHLALRSLLEDKCPHSLGKVLAWLRFHGSASLASGLELDLMARGDMPVFREVVEASARYAVRLGALLDTVPEARWVRFLAWGGSKFAARDLVSGMLREQKLHRAAQLLDLGARAGVDFAACACICIGARPCECSLFRACLGPMDPAAFRLLLGRGLKPDAQPVRGAVFPQLHVEATLLGALVLRGPRAAPCLEALLEAGVDRQVTVWSSYSPPEGSARLEEILSCRADGPQTAARMEFWGQVRATHQVPFDQFARHAPWASDLAAQVRWRGLRSAWVAAVVRAPPGRPPPFYN